MKSKFGANDGRQTVFFDGKFLSSATKTGVHRVALELICSVDEALAAAGGRPGIDFVLLCPTNVLDLPDLKAIRIVKAGRLTWQFWQQFELPLLTPGELVVSLCNLASLPKRRAIVMIHDAQTFSSPASYSASFGGFYRFALPILGRRSVKTLTVSEFAKSELVKYGIAPADKVTVIHNGVDHIHREGVDASIVERLGLSGRPFCVTFSSLQAHKNVGVLFDAYARPEMAGQTLVLIGQDLRAEFTAKGHVLGENIIFAGRLSDAEVSGLYRQAVCQVFPSLTEGFGLPPVEAMAVGCPVVVAPCGALPEVCGDQALYAAPHDPQAWASAVLQLSGEGTEARANRVLSAREWGGRFTWKRAAASLLDVIGDAVGNKRPSAV